MTTIAFDGHSLAADRQVSSDGALYRHSIKLHHVPGGVFACAGSVSQTHKFLRWYKAGMKSEPPVLDCFDAISLVKGKVSEWEGSDEIPSDNQKLAIGSGMVWAMAAMDFGMSAREAVTYAATRDNQTGGTVDVYLPRREPATKKKK